MKKKYGSLIGITSKLSLAISDILFLTFQLLYHILLSINYLVVLVISSQMMNFGLEFLHTLHFQ